MLKHPTLDRLLELGLDGMAKAFEELAANPESRALEHAEWLGLLVEREATLRQQKRFEARARTAKLRHAATVGDVDFRTQRGLDRTLFSATRQLRLDPRASALFDHGQMWNREVLAGLRVGRQGMPR